jgi:HAD superfamily hydrolase (TIGR01458 family)
VRPLDGLLVDLDGVLYVEDEPIPGAVDAVRDLRASGLRLRFVTNTTSRPRAAIVERLARLGFAAEPAEVLTPAALAVEHCRRRGHRRVALLVREAVKADLAGLEEVAEGPADAVVVGDLGRGFTPDRLDAAFRQLVDGAELVALQRNRCWMTPDGLALDVGAYVAALEYGAACEATVVGKPAPAFFAAALADMGIAAARAAMVGDDVESDVGGAQAAGLAGILVRTGKYRAEAVRRAGVEPDLTLPSIAAIAGALAAAGPGRSRSSAPA